MSDGTFIVTNPDRPPMGIVDLTPTSGVSTEMYQEPPRGVRQWLAHRDGRFGQVPGPVPVVPMRGSVIAAMLPPVAAIAMLLLIDAPVVTVPIVVALATLLGVLVLKSIEGRLINVDNVTVVSSVSMDDDDLLRYVPEAVSKTTEWSAVAARADEIGPGSPISLDVHTALWRAAGVTIDPGSGGLADGSLEVLEALAEAVSNLG